MTSWRDDQRFKCPDCGRLIYLTVADPDEHLKAVCTIVAICIGCRHIFLGEEWHVRHVVGNSSNEVDSRPDPG